jgi:hypothetical protein
LQKPYKHFNGNSPKRTTQGYRFNSQSEAEANKTTSAEARSDPQASQTRQPVDFQLLPGGTEGKG